MKVSLKRHRKQGNGKIVPLRLILGQGMEFLRNYLMVGVTPNTIGAIIEHTVGRNVSM
jgi:hypothetical protein